MGITIEPRLRDMAVELIRVGDTIIAIKLVMGKETINVISAYDLQIGLDAEAKAKFWDNLIQEFQEINKYHRGDLNGHVGRDGDNFEQVHGGLGYGTRNDKGKTK